MALLAAELLGENPIPQSATTSSATPEVDGSGWIAAVNALLSASRGNATEARKHVESSRRLGGPSSVERLASTILGDTQPIHPSGPINPALAATDDLLHGQEPFPRRASRFVEKLGPSWVQRCPIDPLEVALGHVSALGRAGRWLEAFRWVESTAEPQASWTTVLRTLSRRACGLGLAAMADLDSARPMLSDTD